MDKTTFKNILSSDEGEIIYRNESETVRVYKLVGETILELNGNIIECNSDSLKILRKLNLLIIDKNLLLYTNETKNRTL